MKDKSQPPSINNVGKIILHHNLTATEDQDHCKIVVYSHYDGIDNYDVKMKLTIPGLQALYKEIGDVLRMFEERRNPR
jgi:hypothetical protein